MVKKQILVSHPLKSQQNPNLSHCSVHWGIFHSSSSWTILVWDRQIHMCFLAVSTKYCNQLGQRQLTCRTVGGRRGYHHQLHQERLNTLSWQPFLWNDDDGKLISWWGENLVYLKSSWLCWEQAFLRVWTEQAD